ncbi:hypothetical protein K466DRAFT_113188 [Polyporus arcularius HHB13444]|uniref:Uncharacterized protein n=1 Tax=Polyporus arcularius HHB13444 TaxID=1314778 RepID=A0A5C3PDQ0_9APHY|nr:hypothetical protein K466DRAFT_113188 [Polyporus arcularius HHB13444]
MEVLQDADRHAKIRNTDACVVKRCIEGSATSQEPYVETILRQGERRTRPRGLYCEIGNIEEICMDGMTLRISRGSYEQRADTEDEPSDRADAAHARPSRTVCIADREMQDKRFHSKDRGVAEGIEESGSFEESSRHVRSEDSEMLTRGSLYNPFLRAPLHPVRPQCHSRVLQRLHRGTGPLVPHAQRRFPIAG